MTDRCLYCDEPFERKTPEQNFCSDPKKHCRQRWHRENKLPGVVRGLKQLKNRSWSVTIHYPGRPDVQREMRVGWPVTNVSGRPNASGSENEEDEV